MELCKAICSGLARQKLHDASSQCESRLLNFRQLSSIIEKCSGSRPVGAWPSHYVDIVHEKDGGDDRGHRRVQDGVAVLDAMLAGLDMRHGVIPVAWEDVDDMSILKPELVIEACHARRKWNTFVRCKSMTWCLEM